MHLEKDIRERGQKKKKVYLCKSVSGKDSGDLYLPFYISHFTFYILYCTKEQEGIFM